jgi:aminodeoxychorismate synthase component I
MWLDSARFHPVTGRWSLLGFDPWLTLRVRGDRCELITSAATHVWRDHPLSALRGVLSRYRCSSPAGLPGRAVGLMGFLSYDLNRWIERLPDPQADPDPVPEMLWFGMRRVVLCDHLTGRSWLFSIVDPHAPEPLARREAQAMLEQDALRLTRGGGPSAAQVEAPRRAVVPEPTTTRAQFEAMVGRALEEIRAGEIFQANVSQRFTAAWEGSPLALYETLRRINPSPFACFLSCEDLSVVSCSPERLVRVQEGRIDTRPIAGTRPRGATPEADVLNSLELLLSEKERAEHIMLVDLARNDLGRVCAAGSVRVNELMALEEYSHVIHIVSDVAGILRARTDAVDVIRAVFPGGTITGCPKVRCMQILRELEPVARGLYTGSLGWLGFDGTMDLNIAIRTMVLRGRRLSFHVGAGIVADSDPEREYEETLAKAGALTAALQADASEALRP